MLTGRSWSGGPGTAVPRPGWPSGPGSSITLTSTSPENSLESTYASAALSATSTYTLNQTCRADVPHPPVRRANSGLIGCEILPYISAGCATSETKTDGLSLGTPMPTKSTNQAFLSLATIMAHPRKVSIRRLTSCDETSGEAAADPVETLPMARLCPQSGKSVGAPEAVAMDACEG